MTSPAASVQANRSKKSSWNQWRSRSASSWRTLRIFCNIAAHSDVHFRQQLLELFRIVAPEHLLAEYHDFLQVGLEHLLLDRQQVRGVHRELAQPEAE